MLGEFLTRLAIALPLVCALAVLVLVAARRGWVRLPISTSRHPRPTAEAPPLQILCVKAVSPAARIAVVRFAGADHLVGVGSQTLVLLASAPDATPPSPHPPGEGSA